MKPQIYNAALYCRLSRDDELHGESSSIGTQRKMLTDYACEQGFRIVDEYIDDGWSGTNFDRPGFQRMIDDIEDGKVNCVITKDLSRLGRNYILTGQYTEIYFPSKGVRYIAISDNVDTCNGDSDIAPFRNILNEMVARDTSRKVKSAMRVKFNNGEYIAPAAPIGYIVDPNNKNKLIIDEETRFIPERIFDLAAHGKGGGAIARILKAEKIPIPTWYRYIRFGERAKRFEREPEEAKYRWNIVSVKHILENECFIGNTVHYRLVKTSFKSKKNRVTSEDEWLRVENTHDPIISKDIWDLAHAHMDSRKRDAKRDEDNIFSRLVYCGECGWSLSSANCKDKSKYLRCTKYSQRGKDECSLHFITYNLLYGVVLARLQYWLSEVHQNSDKLLNRLLQSGDKQRETERRHNEKELKKAQKRKAEVDALFAKMYEDSVCGRLDEDNFKMLTEKYRSEQVELASRVSQLEAQLTESETDTNNAQKWIELIGKYSRIDELTAPLLNELIDKILVHEARIDENGKKVRDIEISYRFVGMIE